MRLNSSQRMKKMFYDHEIDQNHDTRLKLTMKARLKSNLAKILHQMQQRMWPTWTQDKHRVGTHCQKDNQWSQIVWLQKGGGWWVCCGSNMTTKVHTIGTLTSIKQSVKGMKERKPLLPHNYPFSKFTNTDLWIRESLAGISTSFSCYFFFFIIAFVGSILTIQTTICCKN